MRTGPWCSSIHCQTDEFKAIFSTNVRDSPLLARRFLTPGSPELVKLGRRMTIRQQALATAQVFIRRFYTKVEIRRTNPYLVMATALYLACKMEECPQHIRVVVSEARSIWSGKRSNANLSDFADFPKNSSSPTFPSSANASSS